MLFSSVKIAGRSALSALISAVDCIVHSDVLPLSKVIQQDENWIFGDGEMGDAEKGA